MGMTCLPEARRHTALVCITRKDAVCFLQTVSMRRTVLLLMTRSTEFECSVMLSLALCPVHPC